MTTNTTDPTDRPDHPEGSANAHHPSHLAQSEASRETSTSMSKIAAIAVGVTVLVMLILTAFAYPATHADPHNLPIAIVGPPSAVKQISAGLAEQGGDDGFEVTRLADRATAVQAIKDREVYGAIVLGQQGGEMLTASAASSAVSGVLTGIAAGLPEEAGGPLEVSDVVALPAQDQRGAAIGASLLPLIIAGIASGALIFELVHRERTQIAVAALTAVTVGAGVTLILGTWLDALSGSFLGIWGAASLAVASISVMILGWARLLGAAGIGVGAVLVMFIGNPFSGVTSAPELLPAGFGTFGQFAPPGAAGSLLRSAGYFDGAASGMPIAVLFAWVALGLVLMSIGARKGTPKRPA